MLSRSQRKDGTGSGHLLEKRLQTIGEEDDRSDHGDCFARDKREASEHADAKISK